VKQSRYLNVILTVVAVLLTGLLWTHVADRPLLSADAEAMQRPGVPNAAAQRKEIIDTLRILSLQIEQTNRLFKEGKGKIEVTNLKDLEVTVAQSEDDAE